MTVSSNVTATDVAGVHDVEVLVGALLVTVLVPVAVVVADPLPVIGVWLAGHVPVDAVE